MKNNFVEVQVVRDKVVLSSQSLFYKTDNFIKNNRYNSSIDSILIKLCEGILENMSKLSSFNKSTIFSIRTNDGVFGFTFVLGKAIGGDYNNNDIIFVDSIVSSRDVKTMEYLSNHQVISATITSIVDKIDRLQFNKVYLIIGVSGVNLPRLTPIQKEIVESVDKNVIVQGVAGSGKTNICIDKIIHTACKNYTRKTLYSTFSRGLLIDTKLKVELYRQELEYILSCYKSRTITFLDSNHKQALENRLGIYFFSDDDSEIVVKLNKVIDNLTNKVDYCLIEDIYRSKVDNNQFVDQDYFINKYSSNPDNHQVERAFNKLSNYSREIIYKEIYGMILGYYNQVGGVISLQEYIDNRQGEFSVAECESIYLISQDYIKHCHNLGLVDNNLASRAIMGKLDRNNVDYAITILDEVQDYTQVNLAMFANNTLKMFCVGDALQMINPSYFTFGYLKNLLYSQDVTDIKQLKHNYRNSVKIENIVDALGVINKREFGTHNFVVSGESVDDGVDTTAVYVQGDILRKIASSNLDDFTIVVSSLKEKKSLSKIIKNQEVLTVSEIKGLERSTVVAYNLLSDNIDKWKMLSRHKVNHKTADENSIFRYYYNLFYVGITRAKQNIFVVENSVVPQFNAFFRDNFEVCSDSDAISRLTSIIDKVEFTQRDLESRVREFIRLGQWDNAMTACNKIKDNNIRIDLTRLIEVYRNYVNKGLYREGGIRLWEYGQLDEARKQFTLSGDKALIELIDKCSSDSSRDLSIDIIKYYCDVGDNAVAKNFILDTVSRDLNNLKSSFLTIKNNLKGRR